MATTLLGLHFDKGNGAVFSIQHQGQIINFWLSQNNGFLALKASPGQDFCSTVERYTTLIAEAALINIASKGVSQDIWGNEITDEDLSTAQSRKHHSQSAE